MTLEPDILEELQLIFRSVFENERIELTEQTSANEIHNWDSMHHVNLMAKIEAHFGFEFDFDDLISMQNAGDILKVIRREKNL